MSTQTKRGNVTMKRELLLDKYLHDANARAHANGSSLAHPISSRQDICKTLAFIRSINKPGSMPEEVRKERILKGLPISFDDDSFEIVPPIK